MSFITIERQLFYAEAVTYNPPHNNPEATPQVHLRVRCIRVPWGQGFARTIGYMEDTQFGGAERLELHDPEQAKNFYMGINFPNPKLIVADVTKLDLFSRKEMAEYFALRFKQRLARKSFQEHPVSEDIWDKLPPDEREKYARPSSGSKVMWTKKRPLHYAYTFEYPNASFGEVWLLTDPSKPGRNNGVSYETAVDLAKKYFTEKPVLNALFKGMEGERKVFDMDGIIVLGVAYTLRFWRTVQPREGVQWLESIQKNVRTYLANALRAKMVNPPDYKRVNPERTWYAMGLYDLPVASQRFDLTPQNRVKRIRTYEPARGFTPVPLAQEQALKPLFIVRAGNQEEARTKAMAHLAKLNQTDPIRTSQLQSKWFAAGQKMVPVLGTRFARSQKQLS